MEKPKVFASPITKKINNSQELFYESHKNESNSNYSTKDIIKKIDEIFNSYNHVYKSKVLITTDRKEFMCDIVGKTGNNLLTLDGKTIRISEILDIKKI